MIWSVQRNGAEEQNQGVKTATLENKTKKYLVEKKFYFSAVDKRSFCVIRITMASLEWEFGILLSYTLTRTPALIVVGQSRYLNDR